MIRNAFHLTLLATLLSIPAFAKTFNVSPLPVSLYADTEVTTNIAFNTRRIDVEKFELSLSFDNSSSNSIQVALGRDENQDGILDFSETDTVYGCRNGCYFIEDVRGAVRYEENFVDGSQNFNIRMRMKSDYTVKEFLASVDGIQIFTNLTEEISSCLYQTKWNLMRVTRRGIGSPSEYISCNIDYCHFSIIIR
jgi:hypothetical protein